MSQEPSWYDIFEILPTEPVSLTITEIASRTGLRTRQVYSAVSYFAKRGQVKRQSRGRYSVPDLQTHRRITSQDNRKLHEVLDKMGIPRFRRLTLSERIHLSASPDWRNDNSQDSVPTEVSR